MSESKKRKAFSVQEKMDILAQMDANEEMLHWLLNSELRCQN
jgi:hypothetical protein